MGFADQEIVALVCGGHAYGRCHTTSSGYNGAWVENPTLFSNKYAVNLVQDKWIAVVHDTKLPGGGSVPDEVRPVVGKFQYISLSQFQLAEEEPRACDVPDAAVYLP